MNATRGIARRCNSSRAARTSRGAKLSRRSKGRAAMTDAMRLSGKSGMAPALGAAGFTLLAVGISLGILVWRGGAQREILDAESARCIKADLKACDVLRNQCLKRNGEACEALASSIWQSGPNRDLREAMRLYSESCQLRDRSACVGAARKLME